MNDFRALVIPCTNRPPVLCRTANSSSLAQRSALAGASKTLSFPVLAIWAALKHGGLDPEDVDHVAIGWPRPAGTYAHNLKLLLTGKWAIPTRWERLLIGFAQSQRHRGGALDFTRAFGQPRRPIHFINHHLAHALSAYSLSEFDEAAVLVIDGRGSTEATTLGAARGGEIRMLEEYQYPNSVGVFYAGITEALGFQPLSDEWKVMGLAAYGQPTFDLTKLISSTEENYWVDGRRFFGRTDSDWSGLEEVVGKRRNGEELGARHFNLARSAQDACEQAMLAMLRRITRLTGCRKLCLAGGVALNCKANGELLRSGLIDEIYVQPAAGDDGTCIAPHTRFIRNSAFPYRVRPSGILTWGWNSATMRSSEFFKCTNFPIAERPM